MCFPRVTEGHSGVKLKTDSFRGQKGPHTFGFIALDLFPLPSLDYSFKKTLSLCYPRNLPAQASVCVINMKRILILTLAAGMLSAVTPALMAQVSTNTPSQSSTLTPDQRAQQREDRKKVLELLDLSPKDLKGLSPEDRRAKIKEAAEPKIAALKQKKDNGTITADEQADLTLLQNFLHHGGHKAKSDT